MIATKGRFPTGQDANDLGLSRRHLQRAGRIAASVGVDCIDLYQGTRGTHWTPLDETLRGLGDMVRAGKIRYVGLSNYAGRQVQKAVSVAVSTAWRYRSRSSRSTTCSSARWSGRSCPGLLDAGLGLPSGHPGRRMVTGKYQRDTAPVGATRLGRIPRPWCRGLLPPIHPGADVGRGRGGPGHRGQACDLDGSGRPGLAGRLASGHVGDPWCPDARATRGQPGRGRRPSRGRRDRCSRCRE